VNAIVECETMTAATRAAALQLLGRFLAGDAHYRASSAHYGDAGPEALERALDLFLARPEIGFVWLARVSSALRSPRHAAASSRSSTTSRSARAIRGRASARQC
jgi:hypothetical protein